MTQGYAGKFWLWSSFRLIKEEALTVMPSQGCEVFTRLKTPVWEGFHTTHFCWKMGMVGLFLGYWVATGFTTRKKSGETGMPAVQNIPAPEATSISWWNSCCSKIPQNPMIPPVHRLQKAMISGLKKTIWSNLQSFWAGLWVFHLH